jgi:hypothetical protein
MFHAWDGPLTHLGVGIIKTDPRCEVYCTELGNDHMVLEFLDHDNLQVHCLCLCPGPEDDDSEEEDEEDEDPSFFSRGKGRGRRPYYNSYFPMVFGAYPGFGFGRGGNREDGGAYNPGVATAIANSFSTGRRAVATSHATAYGSPQFVPSGYRKNGYVDV